MDTFTLIADQIPWILQVFVIWGRFLRDALNKAIDTFNQYCVNYAKRKTRTDEEKCSCIYTNTADFFSLMIGILGSLSISTVLTNNGYLRLFGLILIGAAFVAYKNISSYNKPLTEEQVRIASIVIPLFCVLFALYALNY